LKRTFVAIPISEEVMELIKSIRKEFNRLEKFVRFVRPESVHITLKFIGDTNEYDFEGIVSNIKKSVASIVPFKVTINGTGVFPDTRRPRVFWLGIIEGLENLRNISLSLNRELAKMGFEEEKREFRGHVTIGRVKRPLLNEEIKSFINFKYEPISFFAKKVIFYESVLKPDGARYIPISVIDI